MPFNKEAYDRLFEAVLALKSKEECAMLFEDMFTITEMNAVSQRLKVAELLRSRHTCQSIAAQTGASTATISRVNRCLVYGTGGYELVLRRLDRKLRKDGKDTKDNSDKENE